VPFELSFPGAWAPKVEVVVTDDVDLGDPSTFHGRRTTPTAPRAAATRQ
jgi:hypothetical protein